ncbi:MAG: hypothetical protein LC620_01840, partial [Halobacteriales archaeon]|nr:hypothetical protein [Halobacteriales archaeon]
MQIRYPLMIATAILILGSGAFLLPRAEAQVGTSSLSGMVCAQDAYPYMETQYQSGCGGDPLPGATVHLTKAG